MYNRTPPRGAESYAVGGPGSGRGSAGMDADRVDLRDLGRKIWRRRWVILGMTVLCAALAGLAVMRVTPLYTATAKVMLDPRQVRIVTSKAVVSNVDVSAQAVNSEVTVLDSNVLIEKVVNKVGFEGLQILDTGQRRSSLSMLKGLLGLGKTAGPVAPGPKVLRAQKVERLVFAIRKATTVRRVAKSFVIAITVKTPKPELSATLAGDIASTYIDSQLGGRRNAARQTAIWIEDRIAALKIGLQKAEAAVDKYRSSALILDGASLKTASQQLVELNSRLAVDRANYTAAKARYDQLANVVKNRGVQAALTLVSSPILATLAQKRVDLVHQDAVWGARYGPEHPTRKRLAREIRQLDTDIAQEVQKQIDTRRNAVATAKILVTSMAASIKQMEQRIITISGNAIGLRDLEQKVTASRRDYQDMLSRLSQTRSQQQLQKPDARIIERATIPGAPASPRPKLMIAMGGMAGLALGLGLAFFLELTTTTFRSAAEVEQDTGLPVLAAIPFGAWSTPLAAYQELERNPTGIFAERIRHLRTAILRNAGLGEDQRGRSILLTSSAPMEGKTTTTLALAKMAALAGKSVIVIDCDLRRSSLQKAFQWDMAFDLGDFIHDKCALGDAIHADPALDFDVLAAARPLPEAADDLSESWLEPMLATLTKYYDLVLLDTPPVLAVSDALVLSQVVDRSIYLVRWDGTARAAVAKGLASFAEMGAAPMGAVLTMVPVREEPMRYAREYAYHA